MNSEVEGSLAMVVPEFSWLCRYSRPIYVRGSNIKVLTTPHEFYGALLVSGSARRVPFTTA